MNEQLSTFATSVTCEACANCCKSLSFWMPDTENIRSRLESIDDSIVGVKRTGLKRGIYDLLYVTIHSPCKHLRSVESEKYQCGIWNDPRRPLMCRAYPSNQFSDISTRKPIRDRDRLSVILELHQESCPALKDIDIALIEKDQLNLFRTLDDLPNN